MNKLNNKAFTLIELIVVIAVLGVLVLIAAPKFLGYTEDAKLVQIKNDVRVSEDMLALELVEDYNFIPKQEWEIVETQSLQEYAGLGDLYDIEGEVEKVVGGVYYKIPKDKVTTKLKGEFISEEKGKVYYYEEGLGREQASIKYTVTFLDNDGNVIEEIVVEEGEAISTPEVPNEIDGLYFKGWDKSLDEIASDMTVSPIYSGPSDVDLGMEDYFEWVSSTSSGTYYNKDGDRGYFKYVEAGEEIIEIPHVIDEVEMTSHYRMFFQTGQDVKKVISTNDKVTDMREMFRNSQSTELDLSSFDTSNVTNMHYMFSSSQAEELDLSSFDTSKVANMSYMFYNNQAVSIKFGDNFDTSKVTSMNDMFFNSQATELDLSSFDTSSVTNMRYMFWSSQAISIKFGNNFDTSKVKNMSNMFSYSKSEELDLSNFNTSNITNMSGMFRNTQVTELDLSSFDTSKVTNMSGMFRGTQVTELDLSSLNTSNVTNMSNMFSYSQAVSIKFGDNFDTSKVTNMNDMFSNTQATELDLSSFDTSEVTSMGSMFQDSQVTLLDLSSFDTSNVTHMGSMFSRSQAEELDLSSFDTSSVTNMSYMFWSSQATTGYARTHDDADNLNDSSGKPSRLTFTVHPNLQ